MGEAVEGARRSLRFSTPHRKKANGDKERRRLPGAGSWPNAEILAGIGSGYKRPLPRYGCGGIVQGEFLVSRQAFGAGEIAEGAGRKTKENKQDSGKRRPRRG